MMSRGVPAGTRMPNHASYSNCGNPASLNVGTSGSSAIRVSPVTASARRSPFWIRSPPTLKKVKANATSPRSTAVLASGNPRNGTIVIFAPIVLRKSSAAIPVALPRPGGAKVHATGRRPGHVGKLPQSLGRRVLRHDEDRRHRRHLGDGNEVRDRIESDIGIDGLDHGVAVRRQHQRVTVGRSLRESRPCRRCRAGFQ